MELLSADAERRRVRIDVHVADDVWVRGRAEDHHRVVANLLSNAVKYSLGGGTVTVALRREGDQAVITVTDEGIGISEVDRQRLFTEFFRSTNPRAVAQPGTGLGLSIVRRIAQLHRAGVEFRDGPQSIKSLHRLICTSAVYRQSSASDPAGEQIDSANQYLWRMNRRKLDAEAVRDAVLAVGGKLDLTAGGPGYRAFAFKDDESPHYDYDQYDPDDPGTHRRSVYRLIVRSVPDPFMTALDCADASATVAKRNETITPLQSLALLNNKFMVRMAEHFAARIEPMGDTNTERLTAYVGGGVHRPCQQRRRRRLHNHKTKHPRLK